MEISLPNSPSAIAQWDSEGMSVSSFAPLPTVVGASDLSLAVASGTEFQWYAVHTRSQHEKSVTARLQADGITTFLPLVSEVHHWSDRRKIVQLPLFPCYVFVQMRLVPESWSKLTRVSGVLRLVGARGHGVPIPESQIQSVKLLLESNLPHKICPFLHIGQRVRVRGGALDGVEGILMARNGDRSLVISVEPIQRSVSVRIDDYRIEPV
jgi:transcription antitermination factor NusG